MGVLHPDRVVCQLPFMLLIFSIWVLGMDASSAGNISGIHFDAYEIMTGISSSFLIITSDHRVIHSMS